MKKDINQIIKKHYPKDSLNFKENEWLTWLMNRKSANDDVNLMKNSKISEIYKLKFLLAYYGIERPQKSEFSRYRPLTDAIEEFHSNILENFINCFNDCVNLKFDEQPFKCRKIIEIAIFLTEKNLHRFLGTITKEDIIIKNNAFSYILSSRFVPILWKEHFHDLILKEIKYERSETAKEILEVYYDSLRFNLYKKFYDKDGAVPYSYDLLNKQMNKLLEILEKVQRNEIDPVWERSFSGVTSMYYGISLLLNEKNQFDVCVSMWMKLFQQCGVKLDACNHKLTVIMYDKIDQSNLKKEEIKNFKTFFKEAVQEQKAYELDSIQSQIKENNNSQKNKKIVKDAFLRMMS